MSKFYSVSCWAVRQRGPSLRKAKWYGVLHCIRETSSVLYLLERTRRYGGSRPIIVDYCCDLLCCHRIWWDWTSEKDALVGASGCLCIGIHSVKFYCCRCLECDWSSVHVDRFLKPGLVIRYFMYDAVVNECSLNSGPHGRCERLRKYS